MCVCITWINTSCGHEGAAREEEARLNGTIEGADRQKDRYRERERGQERDKWRELRGTRMRLKQVEKVG